MGLFVAAAVSVGLALPSLAILPQDLRYEAVDGIEWSYVVVDGNAKVANLNMNTAIDPLTTGSVVVPDTLGGCPVTAIGAYAFYQMTGLTSLTIPEGVEEIEYYACRGCTNLESVWLPSTLTTMGNAVFFDCQKLKTGSIPDSVTSMGRDTFWGCTSMTSVKFSANVATLDAMTCYNCDSLTSIVIPDCVTNIGISAFSNCDNLRSISIPDTVENIGNFAFDKCVSLESLELPSGLTVLNTCFNGCPLLETMRIPANVSSIAPMAFSGCTSMTNIVVDSANGSFKSVDGILFDITGTELVGWPYGRAFTAIPEGVKKICDYVFASRQDISDVVFPNGIETIGAYAFLHTGIQTLSFPSSTTRIGEYAFSSCQRLRSLEVNSTSCVIEQCAFYNCQNLSSISIAEGADVSQYAFGKPVEEHPDVPSVLPGNDTVDIFWTCDFNKGALGHDIQSDQNAYNHVIMIGEDTRATINSDGPGKGLASLHGSAGDSVWFSANEVSGDRTGAYVVPDCGKTLTVSFKYRSFALLGQDEEPDLTFPGVDDGSRKLRQSRGSLATGAVIGLDDKFVLWCSEDDDTESGYLWHIVAGFDDGNGTLEEQSVALVSADDSLELPDLADDWGQIVIKATNDDSDDGLAFSISIGGLAAMSAETGEIVFRAKPSARDMVGVSALGIGCSAYVDDIVFSGIKGDPWATITVSCDAGKLTTGERNALKGIVGNEALNGVSDLRLDPAQGEPDDAPLTCVQLGISPVSLKSFQSRLTLYFKNPTVEITGFDPASRIVTGRVVPAQGTQIVQPPMKYMFGLTKIEKFGTASQYPKEFGDYCSRDKDGFSVDLSHYMASNGMFSIAFPSKIVQNSSAFFTVTIKPYAGRRDEN